jgi:hypothetical protein
VTTVDRVAHRLPDQVRAERPAAQPVALEQRPLLAYVIRLVQGAVDLEVIAPAGELQAVESPG